MRRNLLAACLAALVLVLPSTVSAASWHTYSSKSFGVAFRYPANWHRSVMKSGGMEQVTVFYQGKQVYNLSASWLRVAPSGSLAATMQQVQTYEKETGNATFQSIVFHRTKLAGKSAFAGIMTPPTEGGVAVSQALYIVPWRSHVYQVTFSANGKHPIKAISAFPAVYLQILASWRFI